MIRELTRRDTEWRRWGPLWGLGAKRQWGMGHGGMALRKALSFALTGS
ncbi:hypothetical protein [aff. Roholtiella sp. LEGE 12411]|nr:hypothetical protein [aff. Roholtiella sp. LEGE 12411]